MKYQADYAKELAAQWLKGEHGDVRTKIHNAATKEQAAYLAAMVCVIFCAGEDKANAEAFVNFLYPNQ